MFKTGHNMKDTCAQFNCIMIADNKFMNRIHKFTLTAYAVYS